MTTPNTQRRRRVEQRYTRLVKFGYRSYREYLRSAHWRSVKSRYRASDQPQDCICGEVDGVHLHHLTYERIGAEELHDLTPLCPPCHAMIHELERRGEMGLDFTGLVNAERAARYQEGKERLEWPDDIERVLAACEGWREAASNLPADFANSVRRPLSQCLSRVNVLDRKLTHHATQVWGAR